MIPPMISFVTWNRMGLTAKNLSTILRNDEEFELYIVDNNSQDDTWNFIKDLEDERIKQKIKFDVNKGHVFATNYNLSRRKKEQYFITIDNDVNIHSKKWISKFIDTFDAFPEIGLLGAVTQQNYNNYKLTHLRREKGAFCYLQILKGYVEGCCQCIRPEVFESLGYWNEENCMGDLEMCHRIINYTPYSAGFLPTVEIDQIQYADCNQCSGRDYCSLDKNIKTCFSIRDQKRTQAAVKDFYGSRYREFINSAGNKRTKSYCPSIHDMESMKKGIYDRVKAEKNFIFYMNFLN